MIDRACLILVLAGLAAAATTVDDDTLVKTGYGSIRGYEAFSLNGTRVKIFKAVPFAVPPVGELRWKLPELPAKWTGVRDGTKYSAACMSNSSTTSSPQKVVSEDCLYLNIFAHSACSTTNKCPVVVYLHGGGMNYDSAVYFNDTALIETYASHGIVLVIPAFRLGFTGILDLGDDQELVPANLGVYDALHALKYIKKEVAAFGGNKDLITLMGHSYGGTLATFLAYSPLRKAQVPIHRLVLMSPETRFRDPQEQRNRTIDLVKKAGCEKFSKRLTLACMKSKDGMELLKYQREMEDESFSTETIDGVVMKPPLFPFKSTLDMYKYPPEADMLGGSTIGEMDFPGIPFELGWNNGEYIDSKNVKELDEIYAKMVQANKTNIPHASETQSIYLSIYTVAKSLMKGGRTAYVYSYDQPTHNAHTDDLSYLMGIHIFEKDENEKVLAKLYPTYFQNFIRSGKPESQWTPMDDKDSYYSIEVNLATGRMPEMRQYYQNETIDFWFKRAPKMDKLITVAKAGKAKLEYDKVIGGFRDLTLPMDEDETTDGEYTATTESLVPVILVHTTFVPSFFLIATVFLLGIVLGRLMWNRRAAPEERIWILGPDGVGMRIDPEKARQYAEQMF